MDDDKLQKIVFSDEKTFCTDVSWRAKVYRLPNSRYLPNNLQMTSRSGRITNNYWGVIGYDGPLTDLVRIEGKFNSHKYMRVLRTHLLPIMQDIAAPRIFMQDNSPIHKARNVMALFSCQDFEVLDWPALSCVFTFNTIRICKCVQKRLSCVRTARAIEERNSGVQA